jgi:GntR family transcriptional regulator/MocR family aminotransferase
MLEQRVVGDFMAAGHFARHLKRMRALYGARRRTLADNLSQVLGDRITVELRPGGMHLIARLAHGLHDIELANLAQARGFAVDALSRRAMTHDCGQALLVGFTNVAESEARAVCERLRLVIGRRLNP